MKKLLEKLLDFIYKKKCYFCSKSIENTKMCSQCYQAMEFLPPMPNRSINGLSIYCAGIYEKNLQKLIRAVKYHKQRELAYYQAKFMYEYWQKVPHQTYSYQVIPVPLYKVREKARGYNHMLLVAKEFCKLTGYKLNSEVIKRVKNTEPQYKLTREQRMKNLENAFKINENKILKDKKIMLLDDICTTGSTFESIINEFAKLKIRTIIAFATSTPLEGKGEAQNDFDGIF